MVRFAVIGAGRIGAVHARSIMSSSDAELVVIADPAEGAAQRLADSWGVASTRDVNAVFADDTIDAVIVGSPTPCHVDHIIAGVDSGKWVLCEKPVDLDLVRVDECITRVGERADRVMVGFNRRFDPSFHEIYERVNRGEIGHLEQLTIISRDPAAPPKNYLEQSGGIFRDMTIHDFDLARHFLGDIVSVHATGQQLDPQWDAPNDYDGAVVVLTARNGSTATILNARHCATGYDQRLEAFGPLGALRAENHKATSVRFDSMNSSSAEGAYLNFFLERYAQAYSRELQIFIDAVRTGASPSPSLADGREALALADAAELSARHGGAVQPAVAVMAGS